MDPKTNMALITILSGVQKETTAYATLQSYIYQALAEAAKRAAKTSINDTVMLGLLVEVRMCICELACETDLPAGVWKWYGWMERVVERMGAYLHAGHAQSLTDLLEVFFNEIK
jgi:hypothetical protein